LLKKDENDHVRRFVDCEIVTSLEAGQIYLTSEEVVSKDWMSLHEMWKMQTFVVNIEIK